MAHKAVPLKYLRGTVVQGGADAFKQESVTTGLSGETRKAYRVLHALLEWSGVPTDSADMCLVQFTRKSQSAEVNVNDKSVIFKMKDSAAITTSGGFTTNLVRRVDFPHEDGDTFLIVEDPLYIAIDSTAIGTLTMSYSLAYEEVSISEDDRLNLLVASLS